MVIDDTNEIVLSALKLPILRSIDDISDLTRLSPGLIFALSKFNSRYYNEFEITQKNGKKRWISAPKYSMKVMQLWILRTILEKIEIHNSAMAFRRGKNYGIKMNADLHTGFDYVLRLDLENFFPSIQRKSVFYVFKNRGYSMAISNVFADLCTNNGTLPQGAITSPYLSNIIMKNLDETIYRYCAKNNVQYSRYADDLVFSSETRGILEEIKSFVSTKLSGEGFTVNDKKTRLMTFNNRQVVTGLIVNNADKIHIRRELKYRIRAMIHSDISEHGTLSEKTKGYLAFVNNVDPERTEYFLNYINEMKSR